MRGRRVTIPCPRGRKSRPTILKEEDELQNKFHGGGVRFEDTRFSRGLATNLERKGVESPRRSHTIIFTYDHDLWHIQITAQSGESVLKLVDNSDEFNVHLTTKRHLRG